MLLGFKNQFAPRILNQTKLHTLRKPRKKMPKIGEQLHMYTALRTKHCQLITKQHNLKSIQAVTILLHRNYLMPLKKKGVFFQSQLFIDGKQLKGKKLEAFAIADGFDSYYDFCSFWFIGKKGNYIEERLFLFHWTDLKY